MSLTPQGLEDQFRVQSGQRFIYYRKTICHIVFRPKSVNHTSDPMSVIVCPLSIIFQMTISLHEMATS